MHVLMLPSWYHTEDKPWRGMFFRDHALSLIRAGIRTGLAFVERKSFRSLTLGAIRRQHFQFAGSDEDGIPTLRMKGWSTLAQTTAGGLLWARLTERLVDEYVQRFGVPDVIHGHGAMWAGYAAMRCAGSLGVPYAVTEHASSVVRHTISSRSRRLLRDVYQRADAVVAVSDFARRGVDAVAEAPVARVVPNTVDTVYFRQPAAHRPSSPYVFLFVGDLVKSKRIDLLIEAFRAHRIRRQDSRLVIVGTGKEASRLQQDARGLPIEFTGPLSREGVRQQMWNANVLVLPSAYETFGVVLIEAMSTGLPVIATRCGGPDEIVTSRSGILVENDSISALAEAMCDIRTRQLDPRASASRFRYESIASRMIEIYASVAPRARVA
jgi:glycosyltransferase involved in cell wall biosynthesis